jgi:thioredoxin 1
MVKELHSKEDLRKEVLEQNGYVLLNLRADWCRPCQVMRPVFEATEMDFAGKIRLCSLDVDEQAELSELFHAEGIPTYILFHDGKEIGRIIGYRQKAKFQEILQELLKK